LLVLLRRGITRYAIEMAPSDMTRILNFMNIRSDVQKLLGGMHYRHTYQGNLISLLLYFFLKNMESVLKTGLYFCNKFIFLTTTSHFIDISTKMIIMLQPVNQGSNPKMF
jgi:hypothetical protein